MLDAIDNERKLLIEREQYGAEHVVVHHARRQIEELPAADAVLVEHGAWTDKEVSENTIDEWQTAKCAICGKYHTTPYMYYFSDYAYCPNCGAKMDKED